MNSGWFAVFWEDEGVEEASACNYCVGGKGGVVDACTQNEQKFLS